MAKLRSFASVGETKPLRQNARGVLWQMKVRQSKRVAVPISTPTIMISYSWAWQSLVKRIKTSLSEAGHNVWMDIDEMTGSTLEGMAKAVEEAAVVCVFVSRSYKDSANCRCEAEYAFQLGRIFALYDISCLFTHHNCRKTYYSHFSRSR